MTRFSRRWLVTCLSDFGRRCGFVSLFLGERPVEHPRQPIAGLAETTTNDRQTLLFVGIGQLGAGPDPLAGRGVLIGFPGGRQALRCPVLDGPLPSPTAAAMPARA